MIPHAFATLVEPPLLCARVIADQRSSYLIETNNGVFRSQLRGSTRYTAIDPIDFPITGDYVAILDRGGTMTIEKVLPRTNLFARRAIDGSHDLQPIAANIDRLFVTIAVNKDFNMRRLERYLSAAAAFGVPYGIVLTKIDLVDDVTDFIEDAASTAHGAPVISLCALDGRGLSALDPYRGPDQTIAFVGSSGAGKSTLINALFGESIQTVSEIRGSDDRGRHTTTTRSIIRLDDGTSIVDTPGMREFALADASEGVDAMFDDVSRLSLSCKFFDCRHNTEPGCAVRDNVDDARLANWRKLEREAAFQSRKTDHAAASAEKAKWKAIHKANRADRKRDRFT